VVPSAQISTPVSRAIEIQRKQKRFLLIKSFYKNHFLINI
jgi:hypothetical protein